MSPNKFTACDIHLDDDKVMGQLTFLSRRKKNQHLRKSAHSIRDHM